MTLPDPAALPPPIDPADAEKKRMADAFSQQFWGSYDAKYQGGYAFPQSDPAQDFLNKYQDGQPQPDPNAQVIPDEQWDYKTATTNKMGEALPKGAVGWDPNGNAYYGQGIMGWLNGAASRISDPGVKQAKFDFTKPNTDIGTTVGNIANNVEQATNLTDSFGQDSFMTPVLRTLKEAVGGAFQVLSLPALGFERVVGTASELLQDQLGSYGNNAVKAQSLQEAWDASAITYSSVFDVSRRNQMIERMRAGENPELLAMELENPTVELVGQLVLDPTWVLGVATKGKKAAQILERSTAKLTTGGAITSREVGAIVDSLTVVGKTLEEAQATGRLIDDAEALGHLKKVSAALTTGMEATKTGMGSYKPGFFAKLTASMQAQTSKVTGDHVGWLINTMQELGKNSDDIGDALYHAAMLASENPEQRDRALAYVLKHHPVPKMALAEQGLETANVLWNSVGDNPEAFMKAFGEAQKGGIKGMVEFGYGKMEASAKDMYPSVTAMREATEAIAKGAAPTARQLKLADQYKTMGAGVQAAERFASSLLPTQYRKIVGTMTGVYLSSPGYVMRNIFNNTFTGLVDQGTKFLADKGAIYATDLTGFTNFAEKHLSEMAGGAVRVGGLGKSGDAVDEAFSLSKIIPKWADATERRAGQMVMRSSMQDSLTKLLQPGKFLPDVGGLIQRGMTPEQATMFTRAILDANGDIDKAVMRFRGTAAATGAVDAWRDTSRLLPQKMRDFLGKNGLLDSVLNAVHGKYTSVDDAVDTIIGTIRKSLQEKAKGTVDDAIAITEKHEGAAIAADWSHASELGHIDAGSGSQFTAMLQAGQNLENQAEGALRLIGSAADPHAAVPYMEDLNAAIKETRGQVAQLTQKKTQEAWDIKARLGKMTPEGWSKYLERPVLPGEDPQTLLNEVFKKRFDTVSEMWNSYYVGLKQRADDAYKALSGFITVPDLRVKVDAALKNNDGLFDHYKQVQSAWSDGKNLYTGAKPSEINQAFATAEEAAKAAKFTPMENAVKQAVDGGLNEYQIKNHFKKTGEEMTPEAIRAYAETKGVIPQKVRVPYAGNEPSAAQLAYENLRGIEPNLKNMEKFIRDNWGETMGAFGEDIDGALADYVTQAKPLIAQARKVGLDVAQAARDFSFLDYNDKRGFDAAAAYIMPLEFWPSRTYATWGQRVWTDPGVLAAYGKYKSYMEKIHADMPEFYKYQINPAELLGIQTDNPIFFNLEASLWPLNGLTGVDFNDPYKRTDWWTSLLDDMGKIGPGFATPITAMTAIAMYMRGDQEGAAREAGRLIPQTAQIKAALGLANVTLPNTPFTKGNELDPFVNFFNEDGTDPYERNRIGGSALPQMVADGKITIEQALDAARSKQGPVWEAAKKLATTDRAGATLASWGLGVGWKGRTKADLQIDKFYQNYISLTKQIKGGTISPDDTRQAFDDLRTQFPFMDLVILSKKAGPDRDRAYAYNTLGRLPPGQSGGMADAVGISNELIQKFYDDKGQMTGWPESDRVKFMAGVSDLAAVFAVPDDTTQQSWSAARTAYKGMKDAIKQKFGEDIEDKQSAYFNIGNETQKQRDLQNDYLKLHPEVKDAMDMRTQLVAQIPELTQYYGGLGAIEKYASMQMYADIKSKLGDDIFDKFDEYGMLKLTDPQKAKSFYKQNHLDQYSKIKAVWQEKINNDMARVGAMFVPGAPAQLRLDAPKTTGTQAIAQALQQTPQRSWQEWSTLMPEPLQRMVLDYYSTGQDVPSSGNAFLERMAKNYNYPDVDALLQAMGSSLFQAQGQP